MKLKALSVTLLLFTALQPYIFAQSKLPPGLFDHSFDEVKVRDIPDGFVVLGYYERFEGPGESYDRQYCKPVVARFDRNWNKRWQQTLPEEKGLIGFMDIIQHSQGGFYAIGEYDVDISETVRSHIWLTHFNENGQQIWQRKYQAPGNHHNQGVQILELPGGDLLLSCTIYKNWGSSNNKEYTMRVNTNGDVIWAASPKSKLAYPRGNMRLLEDGMIMIHGCGYESYAKASTNDWVGWVFIFDPDEPSRVILEKTYDDYPSIQMSKMIPLGSGGYWVLGHTFVVGHEPMSVLLMELDKDMNLVRSKQIQRAFEFWVKDYSWDGNSDVLTLNCSARNKSRQYTVQVNGDWQVVNEFE